MPMESSDRRSALNASSSVQIWETTPRYAADLSLLTAMTRSRTGLMPKPAQLRFALALLNKKDVTCVAATGFGKSLAFQMAMFLQENKFGIVVTPIEALGEDQVNKCRDSRLKAVCLVEDDMDANSKTINEILHGKYNLGDYLCLEPPTFEY